ncbi:MFS transporter [Trujillonella endophytica]|uniref:Drug resistance transporter, EmrB/QacA subfamily n=1 Tax=Trujillonella endophytica TaxID=673521 RepID=A0A1H8WEZ8_9ACTN|nr:MFS transporter [Trujillella endophytica]SEP25698.1 drug resistance transporter, EmrB/QacA subfamily [Trujillella endophytica]
MTSDQAPPRVRYQVTYAVLAAAVISFVLQQTMLNPVLPTLQRELDTTQADIAWVLTANFLATAVFTPILGRLGDMVGKKRVLVGALVAVAVGSAIAALATTLPVMVLARVVQGVGGGVIPLAFGVIRDEFPPSRVPGAIGTISSLMAVGGGIGTIVAGPIVDGLGYEWLFWLPCLAVAAAAVGAHLVIPESRTRTGGSINLVAALLLSSWLVCLLLALTQAPKWGWGSPTVVAMLIGGVVLLVVWITVETRARQPLIDMRMMRLRGVWTANVVGLLFGAAMYAGFAFIPQFLQTPESTGYGLQASITLSGLVLLPQSVVSFLTGLASGRLVARFGSKLVLIVGALSCSIGFALFARFNDSLWEVSIIGILMGVGFGLAFSAMANLVVAAVPSSQTGVASGMNTNIRTIGGAVGTALLAGVVTADLQPSGYPAESGYTSAFVLAAAGLLLAALAALLVPAVRRDPITHEEPAAPLRHPQAGTIPGATLVGDGRE